MRKDISNEPVVMFKRFCKAVTFKVAFIRQMTKFYLMSWPSNFKSSPWSHYHFSSLKILYRKEAINRKANVENSISVFVLTWWVRMHIGILEWISLIMYLKTSILRLPFWWPGVFSV